MSVSVIDNIIPDNGGSSGAQLVGTYTGNQTVDVSSYLNSGDTIDNFLVETYSASGMASSLTTSSKAWGSCYGRNAAFTISKSLSGNNLSVSGEGNSGYLATANQGTQGSTSRSFTWKLYHV